MVGVGETWKYSNGAWQPPPSESIGMVKKSDALAAISASFTAAAAAAGAGGAATAAKPFGSCPACFLEVETGTPVGGASHSCRAVSSGPTAVVQLMPLSYLSTADALALTGAPQQSFQGMTSLLLYIVPPGSPLTKPKKKQPTGTMLQARTVGDGVAAAAAAVGAIDPSGAGNESGSNEEKQQGGGGGDDESGGEEEEDEEDAAVAAVAEALADLSSPDGARADSGDGNRKKKAPPPSLLLRPSAAVQGMNRHFGLSADAAQAAESNPLQAAQAADKATGPSDNSGLAFALNGATMWRLPGSSPPFANMVKALKKNRHLLELANAWCRGSKPLPSPAGVAGGGGGRDGDGSGGSGAASADPADGDILRNLTKRESEARARLFRAQKKLQSLTGEILSVVSGNIVLGRMNCTTSIRADAAIAGADAENAASAKKALAAAIGELEQAGLGLQKHAHQLKLFEQGQREFPEVE